MTIRGALVLVLTLSLATPLIVKGQETGKVRVVAILWPGPAVAVPLALPDALRKRLRESGWIEGNNLKIEQRYVEREDGVTDVIAEILRLDPAVILAPGTPVTLATKRATTSIPVVMIAGADPVATGLVSSLARPGGNVTGLVGFAGDLGPKSLELIHELLPKASRVAALWNSANPGAAVWWNETRAAAAMLNLALHSVEARTQTDLDAAFQTIARLRPDALTVGPDPAAIGNRTRIVEFASSQRLPAVYAYREFVISGGLMAYTNSLPDLFRRAADYIDRILRGAKPGDLAVEQPTKFELVINLRTAKAMTLTIPQSLLLRADDVIQ